MIRCHNSHVRNKTPSSDYSQDTPSCEHACIASACHTPLIAHVRRASRLQSTSCSPTSFTKKAEPGSGYRELTERRTLLYKAWPPEDLQQFIQTINIDVWGWNQRMQKKIHISVVHDDSSIHLLFLNSIRNLAIIFKYCVFHSNICLSARHCSISWQC